MCFVSGQGCVQDVIGLNHDSTDARSQAPSKDYDLSDQAWLPKKQLYALRVKAKEAYMLRKTDAKSARVCVSQRHGKF